MENSFTKKFQRRKNNFTKNQEEEERRPPKFQNTKKKSVTSTDFLPSQFFWYWLEKKAYPFDGQINISQN